MLMSCKCLITPSITYQVLQKLTDNNVTVKKFFKYKNVFLSQIRALIVANKILKCYKQNSENKIAKK